MRRLWLLPLCAALSACPQNIDTGADGGGPIELGPNGGIFIRDGAVIQAPAGAVSATTEIFVTVVDTGIPDVAGRTRISYGYRFTPSTLTFQKPITVTLPYLPDRVPSASIDPNTFDMRRNSSVGAYDTLSGESTNPTAICAVVGSNCHVVSANSDRLGLFWATSPQGPAVSALTLTPTTALLRPGQTQQFTAIVNDPQGNPIADAGVAWSIVPPRAASVDQTGLVTALAPGNATLTASVSQQSATATVYIQGTTAGPQTFTHDNPFPTGNDLFGGAVIGGNALFAGGNGTVLALDPSGNWTHAFSFPLLTLYGVAGTPTDAVAVGVGIDSQGNTAGAVVEMKSGAAMPTLTAFPSSLPRAVWFDGNTGMAVGNGNDVVVYQNGGWTNLCPRGTNPNATCYSPSFETLQAVLGNGAGGFVTLGDRGSIYQFDPATSTWNSLYPNQLAVRFDGAYLVDPGGAEAWGVGGNKLWHFSSGAWTAINLPATPVLDSTTAIGPAGGQLAVGGVSAGLGYVLLYTPALPDGGTADGGVPGSWSATSLRGPQVIRGVFSGGGAAYAVGDFGAIWSYGAGGFLERSRGFYGDISDVAVVGTTPIAAVNDTVVSDSGVAQVGSVMVRVDAGVWAPLGIQSFGGPLHSIAANALDDVYVGGNGTVFHYDGNGWMQATLGGGTAGPVYDMEPCGASPNIQAVGSLGTVYTGSQVTFLAAPSFTSQDLHAVHCPQTGDVWSAGDFVLFENATPITSMAVNPGPWRAVWSPGPTEGFAFGQTSYGVYWDGVNMHVIQGPGGLSPEIFPAMWGSSIDNLYLVGSTVTPITSGYGVRFDGAFWNLIDIGAHRRATAVSGSSNTEIWVGTQGGGLLRGN